MANLGSLAGVQNLLASGGQETWTAAANARITELLAMTSRLIEEETGCLFNDSAPETIEVNGQGDGVLFLDKGLRSVTSIVENPATWNGTAWTGGTTLATTDYRLSGKIVRQLSESSASTVYRHLLRVTGWWSGLYVITGVWEDRVPDIPDWINYIANYTAAEVYKKQKASPAGFLGPDNAVVPIRNTLNEPEITRGLAAWRVGPLARVV